MTKVSQNRLFSIAILLIGLIVLVEAAATALLLIQSVTGDLTVVAWIYVLLKALIGLFAIIVGYTSRRS